MTGSLNISPGNPSNYDPAIDILPGPLWPYTLNAAVYKCPADRSTVALNSPWNGNPIGVRVPRVRSYSMSQVFARGEWLDGYLGFTSSQWRIYAKTPEIAVPAKTFLFMEEHPGSINDASFASMCSSNQPTDLPTSARLVDMPANWHDGGCSISFADNHVETHKWRSSYLKNLYNDDTSFPPLNINIGTLDPLGYLDARWIAERTTVPR
jgi:prepilin-type processing-associated H-X9-DG protein